jgi:hypothetical protein
MQDVFSTVKALTSKPTGNTKEDINSLLEELA